MTHPAKKRSLLGVALLFAAIGFAAVAVAADTPAAAPATSKRPAPATAADRSATPEIRSAAPSKAQPPSTAFRRLDARGKGYVTKDDTAALPGFEKAFQDNDRNRDGKLTGDEFEKAWAEYSGNKY